MTQLDGIREFALGKIVAESNGSWADIARESFDAAMNLELPIKFAKWLNQTQEIFLSSTGWRDIETGEWRLEEELYEYWIENIYNIK